MLQDQRPGAAYWCKQCGTWSTMPGIRRGKGCRGRQKEDHKRRQAVSLPRSPPPVALTSQSSEGYLVEIQELKHKLDKATRPSA